MYSVFSTVFVIGVSLIVVGFLGRIGTDGISDVSENVAASLGLLVTFALLIVSLGSFSALTSFLEGICGGIPFLSEIADYGSLQKVLSADPLSAAIAFMDTVILSALIELILMLPLTSGSATGKFMVKLFTGVVVAIVSILLLNRVIKETAVYQWIVSFIGGAIALVSIGTIPLLIVTMFNKNAAAGIGFIAALLLFSKSKIAGVLRSSFLKAIIYVCGIAMLEKYFGSVANGFSQLSALLAVCGPLVISLIGIVLILKSVKLF